MYQPPWLKAAYSLLGTREAAGPADNPTIINWARKLGATILGIAYNHDSTPWCGLFAAYCMSEVGLTPPRIAVRAKQWATWGDDMPEPVPGAVMVFNRVGGGHVAFYVSENATRYQVIGGNQGDEVTLAWLPKSLCIAKRWPSGVAVVTDKQS